MRCRRWFSLAALSALAVSGPDRTEGHHSQRSAGIQPGRRLPGGQLHPARSLLEETRQRVRSHETGGHRPHGRRPAPVHGDHHLAGEHEEAGSLQGHLAPAGAGRRAHGGPGSRAGPRGQSRGVDRRRAARQRVGGLAAGNGDGLPDGEPHGSGNHAFSERRDSAVRAGQPGRPGTGRQLVHARLGETGRAPEGPAQAHHGRPAAAVRQVHRPRRQPRLLHVQHAGDHQHEPRSFSWSGFRRSCTTTTRPDRPAR